MKKIILFLSLVFSLAILVISCGGSGDNSSNNSSTPAEATTDAGSGTPSASENPSYDPKRGEGKFHDVKLSDKLDKKEADEGEKIYELKCRSCHKLSDERLVGPGWKGVSSRHSPDWILNFVTNTDEMIDKDPKAQAMLEICMVRMPNQNLTDDNAMQILEFMRENDGLK
ncbi:MAG: cytochrome c [Ginsengibacter sp.]